MADARAQHRQQPSVSLFTTFIRWLQLKNYQYEVTFSLYMLTSTEKWVFNSILIILTSLLVTAAYLYLPAHLFVIYSRVWYYISGEYTFARPSNMVGNLGSALKATKEVLVSHTVNSIIASQTTGNAAAKVTAETLRNEL